MEPIKAPERWRWLQINSAFKNWQDFIQKQVSALVLYKNPNLWSLYRFRGVCSSIHTISNCIFFPSWDWILLNFNHSSSWLLLPVQMVHGEIRPPCMMMDCYEIQYRHTSQRGIFVPPLDLLPGWHFCIKWNILTTVRWISVKFGANVLFPDDTSTLSIILFSFHRSVKVKNGRRPWRTYRQTRQAYKTCNDP